MNPDFNRNIFNDHSPEAYFGYFSDSPLRNCIEWLERDSNFHPEHVNRVLSGLVENWKQSDGKKPEIKKCIYLNDSVTDEEIRNNLISNPIKALSESGYFFFNNEDQSLILSQEIWPLLGRSEKLRINKICLMRLQKYFNDN